MKTNAKQIESIATLIKPFDAIQTAHFLAREIVGFNKTSDKLVDLQKQIDDTKIEKGTRKKAVDNLLKELWNNNVKMVAGKGVTKCPIRLALRDVLDKEGLADTTKNNILTAVSFALEHKKPYDIHAPAKYNAAIKAEKEKEKLKSEILKNAIPPATPSATTPSAATPSATTPSATTPSATTPSATTKKSTRLDYCKDAFALVKLLFDATQVKRYDDDVSDTDILHYNVILDSIDTIMDTLILLSKPKQDKDAANVIDDMDDMDDMDDDLGIDSELVD